MASNLTDRRQPPIDGVVVKQFLNNQEMALQNQRMFLENRKHDSDNLLKQAEYDRDLAEKSIEAHSQANRRRDWMRSCLYGGLILAVTVVLITLIVLNKDDLAKELLKIVGSAALGFIAGRGSGIMSKKSEE